ncbi:hypothetical protein SRHO_G00313720 [Serrasalmus rhombeus]
MAAGEMDTHCLNDPMKYCILGAAERLPWTRAHTNSPSQRRLNSAPYRLPLHCGGAGPGRVTGWENRPHD